MRAIAVAVAAGLVSASVLAQSPPNTPSATPDNQSGAASTRSGQAPSTAPGQAPNRPRAELHGLQSLDEARDAGAPRHERWEKAAYLGVATTPAQPALRQQLHLPRGVGLVIDFIEPGSPADQAGLRQYDVLHKLDDQILVNPQQLAVLVRIRQPGDSIKLAIIREGKSLPIDVKLIEKEVPPLEELRLDSGEPAGGGAPMLGGNDWPGLAGFPDQRVGMPLPPLPQSNGALHVDWNDGSADMAVTGQGMHHFLVLRDKAGKVLFRGPIDTPDQRAGIPKEQRQRLQSLPEPFKLPAEPAPATRPGTSKPH